MALLSDTSIREHLKQGLITIKPALEEKNIRQFGIRLHLDNELLIPKNNQVINPMEPTTIEYDTISDFSEGYLLEPGGFVLGATCELIGSSKSIAGLLDGRSTLARLGLTIHNTAMMINGIVGEEQCIVLEIANQGPLSILLTPNMPIGEIQFIKLSSEVTGSSQIQYKKQEGVQGANLDFQP